MNKQAEYINHKKKQQMPPKIYWEQRPTTILAITDIKVLVHIVVSFLQVQFTKDNISVISNKRIHLLQSPPTCTNPQPH